MNEMSIGMAALIIHLLISAVFFLLMVKGILKVKPYIVPFVLFVPFWGAVSALVLHFHLKAHEEAVSEIPMEKMRIDDEIYRSLAPDVNAAKDVAPLEEVLMLAPSDTRRSMMLDILNDSPEQYTQVLLTARSGDDTEVVHYATTAMAEMSKRHDIELQRYENAFADNPSNPDLLRDYSDFLEDYLAKGFAEGRTEKIERSQLIKLLTKRAETEKTPELMERLVRQLFTQQSYGDAQEIIAEMIRLWPKREEPRLLEIECHALLMEGDKLHDSIRRAREDGVYFSQDGEARIRFWIDG